MIASIEYHGLPAVALESPEGASAIVTLHGAQVVSWIPAGGREQLFMSARSAFAQGRAIRGGVPIVFPQFAELGPLPKHGFARTCVWRPDGDGAQAIFTLQDSHETRGIWPHAFALTFTVTIGGPHLDMRLDVRNRDASEWPFRAALHTYHWVSDATRARVAGFRGTRYTEREGGEGIDSNAFVTAAGPIDRVYLVPPKATRLLDGDRTVEISQHGFPDSVVWNPGRGATAAMTDMEPEGYRNMLCVEAAIFASPVVLQPGESWSGTQALTLPGR